MNMLDIFPVDEKIILGTRHFSRDDILTFARAFDPQPFHTDEEAAQNFVFGALCASGWHSCAGWMRCLFDYWQSTTEALRAEGKTPPILGPSPGFRDLKWLKPVFVGDDITYSLTAKTSRALASRPGWRINTSIAEGFNQKNEPVLRFTSVVLEQEVPHERA
ncbi:MaoC family dehydratase [Allorhizobium sp. BGMRC 0089]|uniref:MaoC family dehydratase n=1 Tax=Allorhizobium sonneratiae TaxID=2934936 RepID=UPI00203352DE|nr:MaoC family dehydratase [Allorhizobium sonneratiae]MCM2291216.1 MaoC family dehydratase [Allorhizobium sonneratiae]